MPGQPPGRADMSGCIPLHFHISGRNPRPRKWIDVSTKRECLLASICAKRHWVASARMTGLEPATSGSTVRRSNQLSYIPSIRQFLLHHRYSLFLSKQSCDFLAAFLEERKRPRRAEPRKGPDGGTLTPAPYGTRLAGFFNAQGAPFQHSLPFPHAGHAAAPVA